MPFARRPRLRHALLLVATLLLGWAAHGWHHLVDPDCDSGRGPLSHPCVACAALHGSALPGTAVVDAAPVRHEVREALCAPHARAVAVDTRRSVAPRAPPPALHPESRA